MFFILFQDSIAKVFIDTNSPSKYILVTKDGQINNLSSVLNIRRNTHANVDVTDFKKILNRKRRMKIWVTDCIILTEINKLVVATVNRDLQFFDMATPVYVQIFRLIGKIFSITSFLVLVQFGFYFFALPFSNNSLALSFIMLKNGLTLKILKYV